MSHDYMDRVWDVLTEFQGEYFEGCMLWLLVNPAFLTTWAGLDLVEGGIQREIDLGQNLFFGFVYNAVGVPLAAGVFYLLLGWLLSPMNASAAMSFSSVSVIGNAPRLRRLAL